MSAVHKAAALLCLLAIVVAQVPLLACAADCQDVLVSAAGDHSCHKVACGTSTCTAGSCGTTRIGQKRQRHLLMPALGHHDTHRHVGDHRGHSHGVPADVPTGGEEDSPTPHDGSHGLHEVIQVSVVSAGFRLALPEHTPIGTVLILDTRPEALPTAQSVLEAAHLAEPDPVPVPPPASVRLLL